LPFGASHEVLARSDHLYDLVVVLGHNDAPAISGMGSAIFLHLASPSFGPTEGCVAVREPVLRRILASADTVTAMEIL
jgi:L,D-peptidoglycan transpeptidase YkuD (ErfK/YbiS/YcfS/YnhG family)